MDKSYQEDVLKAKYILIPFQGNMVPYFIESYDDSTELIKLEKIDSPDKARLLGDSEIFILDKDIRQTKKEIKAFTIIGFELYDQDENVVGPVRDILELPKQVLLEVRHVALNESKLVPFHTDLVVDIDIDKRKISMTLPEGLFNL